MTQVPPRKTLTKPTQTSTSAPKKAVRKPQAQASKPASTNAKSALGVADKSNLTPQVNVDTPSQADNKPKANPTPDLLAIKPDALATSLLGAAQAVSYVLDGVALPQALSRVFEQSKAEASTRGAIQDIAYRTMRQVGRADALITLMTNKPAEPPLLYCLLCCALTLLIKEPGVAAPYGEFVVVDQAVNAAASSAQLVFAKGMVNAVLRRFLREQESLLPVAMKQPAALWNYPQWWVDQCKAAYPQDWQAILLSGNQPPPLTLRVNRRQISVADYLQLLEQNAMTARVVGQSAVRLDKPVPVAQIPGFEQGMVSVQDAGAQIAVELLDLQDGMRVLDACAAPGGKTGHILETADVELVAVEIDVKRAERIHENLARLKLFATILQGDATRSNWWDRQPFDRIVADVPCTASGVVRRHPDIRWLRRKTDAAQLSVNAARILDNCWRLLKPGGRLLMITCSIWPIESETQAAAFATRSGAIRLPAPGQLHPTSDGNNDHDGLFYALFEKPAV